MRKVKVPLGFDDFSCGNAAGTDLSSFDRSVDFDLDFLEVRKKSAQSFSDDLGTGTARPFDLSASFIFYAGDGSLMADGTYV